MLAQGCRPAMWVGVPVPGMPACRNYVYSEAMSTKYKFRDQSKLYFISFAVVYWIDVFIRNEYKDILLDSWRYCQKAKGLELYAWCIMSSHVHMMTGRSQTW